MNRNIADIMMITLSILFGFIIGGLFGSFMRSEHLLKLEKDIALGNIIQLDKLFFKCDYVVRGNHESAHKH